MLTTTRFAPSPTGFLHLGHAYAALVAQRAARNAGGKFLVRMEDIDFTRVRENFYEAILEDLTWLGLLWDGPVWRQLDRLPAYSAALASLDKLGVLYPCFCTRKELSELSAPQEGVMDSLPYSGKCRQLSSAERAERQASGQPYAMRLSAQRALALAGSISWRDQRFGKQTVLPDLLDDVVLARKDIGTSYHLAVVVDDAAQDITLVTRGEDLLAATHIHRLLQQLLGLPEPEYFHHELIRDEAGNRLAKRDAARSLRSLRESGRTAEEVLSMLPLSANRPGSRS